MVLARVADFFTNGDSNHNLVDDRRRDVGHTAETMAKSAAETVQRAVEEDIDDDAARPPYLHVSMANGRIMRNGN